MRSWTRSTSSSPVPVLGEARRAQAAARTSGSSKDREVRSAIDLAQALFAPRSVALVGASGDEAKNTARPQRYPAKYGFAGKIVPDQSGPVARFSAFPAYKSRCRNTRNDRPRLHHGGRRRRRARGLRQGGRAGRDHLHRRLRRRRRRGPGAPAAARRARAQALGVRLLGPNSMGMINLARPLPDHRERGAGDGRPARGRDEHRLAERHHAGHGAVARRGARPGLRQAGVGRQRGRHRRGRARRDARRRRRDARRSCCSWRRCATRRALARGARAAHAAGKPVVAYKLGRSKLGERLARSHTGALAGEDAALDAYFRDCGIVRVDMLETLIEIGPLLAGRAPPPGSRARAARRRGDHDRRRRRRRWWTGSARTASNRLARTPHGRRSST